MKQYARSALAPYATYLIALIAFGMRIFHLDQPKGLVFDELYYVNGAQDYLKFGVEVDGSKPEFIVHPPVGKWAIALGIKLFGNHEFGWRIASAVFGSFLVLLVGLIARELFKSDSWAALASGLTALDGLALVHSRTALLDLFLSFFVALALWAWLKNWHWFAGFAFGLAAATKWSGLYFLIVFALITFYRISTAHSGRAVIWKLAKFKLQYGVLPVATYLASWIGWFRSDRGWDRNWSTNVFKSFWHYHAEMLNFHTGLVQKHSYQANPWSWLIQGRPTSFFYGSPKGCGSSSCSQEVLALGTPLLWWFGTIALFFVLGILIRNFLTKENDFVPVFIWAGLVAGYFPWFLFQKRTVFSFYAIVFEPFVIFALVYCAKFLLESKVKREVSQGLITVTTLLIALNFIYFYPLFTGEVISYNAWYAHMWLPSWI
jgi:dolichyl-phosphate-mannose--protein O-mannosyl transferase